MSQSIVLDSYPSGVTDFNTVFSVAPQAVKDQILEQVVHVMADFEFRNDSGHFVAVVIVGHADRRTDLGADAAREAELEASSDRANSARDTIFSWVQQWLLDWGGVVPADRDSAITFAMAVFSNGAARLVNPTATSEQDRLKNRRVEIYVQKFPKF